MVRERGHTTPRIVRAENRTRKRTEDGGGKVVSERAACFSSHFLRDDDGGGPQRPPALRRGRGGVRRERDAVEVDERDDVAFHGVAGAILGRHSTRRDTENDRDRRR